MIEPKHGIIAALIGKGPPPADEGEDDEHEAEDMHGHMHGSMEEFIEAVHAKDVERAVEAFEAMHSICEAKEDEESEGEEHEEGKEDEHAEE